MRARVEWAGAPAFFQFAAALGVEPTSIAAAVPRGGHDEPEIWHVFFTTPETEDGDVLDVLLGVGDDGQLEEKSSRRLLVGFFDELYRQLDDLSAGPGNRS